MKGQSAQKYSVPFYLVHLRIVFFSEINRKLDAILPHTYVHVCMWYTGEFKYLTYVIGRATGTRIRNLGVEICRVLKKKKNRG